MAHSSTTATAMPPSDLSYYFKDENGKILKLLKKSDIKQEAANVVTHYTNNEMGAFNQIISSQQQPSYVRLSNSYNVQPTEVISGSSHGSSNSGSSSQHIIAIKYENPSNTSVLSKMSGVGGGGGGGGVGGVGFVARSNHNMKPTKTKFNASPVQRKRKPEKGGKGLRHFSMKVCEKVKEKGTTTYNEVADELVNEELQNHSYDAANCDQKNIRRRVYDALNVLMAMQIISKDKKEIRWIGLPTNSMEQCSALEKENEERRERIREKHQQLYELILQQVSFKALIERNKEAERKGIIPTPNSSAPLPFIIVNTSKQTKINCSVTNDKSEYIFKFDDKFEMHDDAQVLKRMGFLRGLDKGQSSYEDIERLKTLVPLNFGKYIEAYGKGVTPECESDDEDMANFMGLSNDSQECFSRVANELKTPDDLDDEEDEFLENSDNE